MKSIFPVILLTSLLTACSSGPSDKEMEIALQKNVDQTVGALLGDSKESRDARPKFTSVRRLDCKGDGEKAYKCDVELEVSSMLGKQKSTQSIRFVKGSDGWAVAS